MKKMEKILSLVLILIMCFSIVPIMDLGIEASAASNNWAWPTISTTVSANWPNYSDGDYHGGIDFPVGVGSSVFSTCDGQVVDIKSLTTSYGKHIKIKATVNGSTVYMRYCHLSGFAVAIGDKVTAGQLIGYSGNTGNSSGAHLHYEVRNSNDYYGNSSSPNLNPRNYLPGSSYTFETHTPADTTKPTISKVYIEPPKSTSYRACCTCSDNVGVAYVKVATWTTKDQSDLVWRDGIDNSQGTWFVDVYYSEHAKDAKYYYNHFYVYDAAGNCTFSIYDYVDTEAPVISNVKITNYSDSYLITCNVSDNIGITSVSFPTWTHSNGQDDLIWHEGTLNGNIASCRIYKSNHKNESGKYETDIYAYDALGNSGKSVNTTYIANTTVKFNANGGSTSTTSKTVTYGNTYGTLPTPTKSGYNFNGWYTASSGGSKVTSSTSVTATRDHTLYAQWTCTHSTTEIRNAKSATCTATGYTGDTYCKTCGTKLKAGTTIAKKAHSYTATITTQPTCTKEGVKTYKCSCGASYTEAIAKTAHNSNTTIPAVAATCKATGLTEGKKCSVCGTVTVAQQTVAKKSHIDNNGDYKCDYGCGYAFEKPADPTPDTPEDTKKDCSCNCHKGGISGFFFKLINFFEKLFGKNKVCACGVKH